MAIKKASKAMLDELLVLLVEMIRSEINWHKKKDVPMAAADKTVIVTLLKNNDVTAAPEDKVLDDLREEFKNLESPRLRAKGEAIIAATQKNYLS